MSEPQILPWITRNDLVSVEFPEFSGLKVVVKDPVKNEFFDFGEVEYFILSSLRKPVTLAQLRSKIRKKFKQLLCDSDIINYINRLAGDNLLVARRFGDGERLCRQSQALNSSGFWRSIFGFLSFRFPGFYPGYILPAFRWVGWTLFNPISIFALAFLFICTMIYSVFSFASLAEKAPSLSQLMSVEHLALITIGFVVAKVLHELGHALACQYTGHECSEMGVMLLVFIPCLYCDVSDMWTERSRWKRILVSLSGVYVEVFIAIVCFWIWNFTVHGRLNEFLYGMMLITSVNTIFINGNPLLRYDGYYALSDFAKTPNLATVSKNYFSSLVGRYFLNDFDYIRVKKPIFLVAYAVSSYVYRWLILFAIGWAIWFFFENADLYAIGLLVVLLSLTTAVIPLVMNFKKAIRNLLQYGPKFANSLIFFAIVGLLGYLAFTVEFSDRTWGTARLNLADGKELFATENGFFKTDKQDGELVEKGELIASIVSDDLDKEKIELEGQLTVVGSQLKALKRMPDSSSSTYDNEFLLERKNSLEASLAELKKRVANLDIRAPSTGILVGTANQAESNDKLNSFNGTVFDSKNVGCFVQRGTSIGYIGSSKKQMGFLDVPETQIEKIALEAKVRLFSFDASEEIVGRVTKISLEGRKSTTISEVTSQTESSKLHNVFVVEFELETDREIRVNSQHKVVIEAKPTTCALYLKRWWNDSVWY